MLAWLRLPFECTAADTDETPLPAEDPAALALRLSRAKARAIRDANNVTWVLAADTVVEHTGQPLGKPRDAGEAMTMLQRLRLGPHAVHTAIVLRSATGREAFRRVTTQVWMRPYTTAEIAAYIASGDPFDKAGAYAIQHPEFRPVAHLDRCYANVVGLPLCAAAALLRAWDAPLAMNMPALCQRHFDYRCPHIDEGSAYG